jgi:small-conductance mechanosensitive channel
MLLTPATRDWAATHGLRVVVILLLALLARQIVARTVPPAVRRSLVFGYAEEDARIEQLKRADTLAGVILGTTTAIVFLVAAFFVLAEVGFSIAPVIAGVSITGIAVGLGAQTLVKDVLNGMFILGENQFRRGDMVTIANVSGTVEDVSLRRTLLRGEDGTVYVVPNSAISVAGNHTRGYSGIYFLVAISFQADLERAIAEIDRIGRELTADRDFGPLIIDSPRALAVDALEDSYVNLRIDGRARPGAQGRVAGELRRRIKQEFDRLGIAYRGSPSPQRGPG